MRHGLRAAGLSVTRIHELHEDRSRRIDVIGNSLLSMAIDAPSRCVTRRESACLRSTSISTPVPLHRNHREDPRRDRRTRCAARWLDHHALHGGECVMERRRAQRARTPRARSSIQPAEPHAPLHSPSVGAIAEARSRAKVLLSRAIWGRSRESSPRTAVRNETPSSTRVLHRSNSILLRANFILLRVKFSVARGTALPTPICIP